MKCLLILNPVAGQGRPEGSLETISLALHDLVSEIVVTQQAGDAEAAAKRAAETAQFDAVLVAGGDGTLNEAINGLMAGSAQGGALVPLGILPLGTQNVLAHDLAVPPFLDDLVALLKAGHTRRIDLGRAHNRYFALMAGYGFDAAVINEVFRPVKELIGPAAYAFATLGALAKYRSTHVRLVLDEEEFATEAFLIVIANAASYAFGQIKLAPFARVDDGWLDVCVFERAPTDKVGFVTQIMAVMARRHLRDPRVRYYRARRVQIFSDPPVQGQLDGDAFEMTPVDIRIVPQALSVFVPK